MINTTLSSLFISFLFLLILFRFLKLLFISMLSGILLNFLPLRKQLINKILSASTCQKHTSYITECLVYPPPYITTPTYSFFKSYIVQKALHNRNDPPSRHQTLHTSQRIHKHLTVLKLNCIFKCCGLSVQPPHFQARHQRKRPTPCYKTSN